MAATAASPAASFVSVDRLRAASSSEADAPSLFSPHERDVLAALAATAIPEGKLLPGGGAGTVERMERLYGKAFPPAVSKGIRALVWAAELGSLAMKGRPFSRLSPDERHAVLRRWYDSDIAIVRNLLRALLTPLKSAHFDTREMHELVGCPFDVQVPTTPEREPWMSNCVDGTAVGADDRVECDVVIVGSGAGGGALAYQLVSAGYAVVVLEGGRYLKRRDFGGRPSHLAARAYVDRGLSFSLGNLGAPVWAGRTVGGSTTINSGTCYRAPDRVLHRWQEEGLHMLGPADLSPYYARVEAMLGVEPAQAEHLGVVADIVARGATRLGLSHGPLQRNAPGCDGQGQCCFGCPTGAKRSADVSWIPEALKRGALLYASTQVERIETENGRAVGVVARTSGGARLTVRARATVVAAGALLTPVLLEQSELCGKSGWRGRNLSIHPAGKVLGLFPERVEQWRGIPQSYTIDQFKDEGLLFEGGSTPFSVTAVALPFFGPRFTDAMERFPHLATFGFMIQDSSRGRVRRRPGGGPLITYDLNRRDTERMLRGLSVLSEVFLEAGAGAVFPGIVGLDALESRADLERMRARDIPADRLEVTAFHPLGTARMGVDPTASVVGPDHETHEVRDLFVVDGSVMPGPLGVNPQMTIMALALRAGDVIGRRLAYGSA